jgi:hypothetical protein
MGNVIILAPHIDDEVIGCYSKLSEVTDVYYFYECTKERKKEAKRVAKLFGYRVHFNAKIDKINFNKVKRVYAPGSYDLHKDHKTVNKKIKQIHLEHSFELFFYSIDMNRKPVYLKKDSSKKKKLLDIFKSQNTLFNDEKYFLFEDIYQKDFLEEWVYNLDDVTLISNISIKLQDIYDNIHLHPEQFYITLTKKYPELSLLYKTKVKQFKFQ